MRLIAQKTMRYATRLLTVGDEFQATDKDGRLLVLARAAAEVAPEETTVDEDEAERDPPPRKRRQYRRRDMRAEE